MENQEQHKRRVRYKGTHPRKYNEKYKELQPDKYPETVERVIKKGSTPVGMHISICVKEILEFLQIQPGQKGLDATLGYGGHTQAMLECLQGKGHIYGLDVDAVEQEKTRKRLEALGYGPELLTVRKLNFANIDQVAAEAGTFDLCWRIWGFHRCRLITRTEAFLTRMRGRWISVWILKKESQRQSALKIFPGKNWRGCWRRTRMNLMRLRFPAQ